jgi:HAD superfamily hydrolase (TIGR01450 family)
MSAAITFADLRTRHAAILFDAYGVLVDASGALPGAAEAIAALRRDGQRFLVVTNDASRSPERAADRFQRLGLDVAPGQVLSSGMMITPAIAAIAAERGVAPAALRAVVLGTRDSADYARAAGVEVIAPSVDEPADVVVVADEGGFPLLETMDETLSMLVAAITAGRAPRLLLANPDLVYPAARTRMGFTAGSLALMLESALALVLGDAAPHFEPLGKPARVIFEEAVRRVGTRDAVMVGDQLHTDIAGANAAGLASALLLGGVSHHRAREARGDHEPTYRLTSL